jgi:hypothetical protein
MMMGCSLNKDGSIVEAFNVFNLADSELQKFADRKYFQVG